jgi:uncharacterized membrane protein
MLVDSMVGASGLEKAPPEAAQKFKIPRQYFITNNGQVSGAAAISNTTMHAALWSKGVRMDIGTPGLNSVAFGVNERGQVVGEAETSTPNGEDFAASTSMGFPIGYDMSPVRVSKRRDD